MFKILATFTCCLSGLAPSSAMAGPNVFWTFGLDRHYAHGAGGRAALLSDIQVARAELPAQNASNVGVDLAFVLTSNVAVSEPLRPKAAAGDELSEQAAGRH